MWTKPWKYAEGFVIGAGIVTTGGVLQLIFGQIDWNAFAWPVNAIVLVLYLTALIGLYIFRKDFYPAEWMMHFKAALPAIAWCIALTLVIGLTTWNLLGFWPFVLVYFWMTSIIGLACIGRIARFRMKDIPFLLNHLGLFLALVAGTLGNADIRKHDVTLVEGSEPIMQGSMGEPLPVALQLHSFTLEQYPPKLMLTEGEGISKDADAFLSVENGTLEGTLGGWDIRIQQNIPCASKDSLSDGYKAWIHEGGCCAVEVEAQKDGTILTGWVSGGSIMFPSSTVAMPDGRSIAMAVREPKRYASEISAFRADGSRIDGTVEVNKPVKVNGWKIYQVDYDHALGQWSNISILQLVKDPWLPFVYSGIFMLLAGAVCNFWTAARKKDEEEDA